ncbi:MAG TPA: SPFH domain-containing protein [Candidatus Limnocylindrales bacterium]|nr:SPFH domain-containing protein [Candidatus Limnocylindrales bacterium]
MLFVRANPNQYLLTGSGGRLQNRGSAVRAFLPPGTVWVLVPSTKQEATFEFTQETRDGIPLRFKGVVIYRITDPIATAAQFDFSSAIGADRINALLTHVCLGELRHAVSHMTMVECIEQRKTTLSEVVAAALAASIDGEGASWGITIEVAQVAQVYIVDRDLRAQLEAEVRNEIKLTSDRSDIETKEATRLAEMASEGRVEEQRLAADRERLRRDEELGLAGIERDRRMQAEAVATAQRAIELELERSRTELAAEGQRAEAEAPVRLLKIEKDTAVLREELAMRELRGRVKALEVDEELALRRAEQDLRAAILPLEQAPEIVDAASHVLQGTNLSIYGENGALVQQLVPVLDVLARAAGRAAGIAVDPRA